MNNLPGFFFCKKKKNEHMRKHANYMNNTNHSYIIMYLRVLTWLYYLVAHISTKIPQY